ncbi:hypothetical protein FK219_008705 [Chryseoglobus sp. KN1116]|uniref:Pyroglutamyl-peptidase I n=1 Tax=Microcella pacifica TaxID=2591847 RepID=A0A9E5MIV6_9MICO|nr:hypothetical protein [Microcella pacifica]
MTTPTVLVTGFEPFGGDDVNPSGELARRLGELGHPDCTEGSAHGIAERLIIVVLVDQDRQVARHQR